MRRALELLLQQGSGRADVAGRSTLDQKKRAEIYTKAQTILFEDAAYVFKWGLRGVWGISNRVNYEAPRDEIDRMWLVTPRKR